MPFSIILNFLGLSQKNRHFISERKRELTKLTAEYEKTLRQAHEILLRAKLLFDNSLKDLPIDTSVIEMELEKRINQSNLALAQIEEQRELHLTKRAVNLSIEQWDELISRRQIQKSAAEYALQSAESSKEKIEAICNNLDEN